MPRDWAKTPRAAAIISLALVTTSNHRSESCTVFWNGPCEKSGSGQLKCWTTQVRFLKTFYSASICKKDLGVGGRQRGHPQWPDQPGSKRYLGRGPTSAISSCSNFDSSCANTTAAAKLISRSSLSWQHNLSTTLSTIHDTSRSKQLCGQIRSSPRTSLAVGELEKIKETLKWLFQNPESICLPLIKQQY